MTEQHAIQEKSLVLIGFMGAGKTTIGEIIGDKLLRDFIDIDEEIEKEYGMPTTEIFRKFGEKEFRQKEKQYIKHFCRQPLKVISLGGGAFMQEEIRKTCLTESIVFYLDISWDAWQERLPLLVDSRPVLQDKSLQEIKQLFNERKSTYEPHDVKVMTDSLNPEQAADQIIATLKLKWSQD